MPHTGMSMTPVESSVIESVGHNGLRLRIRFKSGKTYDFEGAPLSHLDGMLKAESAGAYFGKHVRGKFRETAVG